MPHSEERLYAHLGTVPLAFDVPQEILNKGSKYSSKPGLGTTQKAKRGCCKEGGPSEVKGSAVSTHHTLILGLDFSIKDTPGSQV